jgi:hypothetical protein
MWAMPLSMVRSALPHNSKTRSPVPVRLLGVPGEEWVQKEPNIYVAASRLVGGHKEQSKLYREISNV